MTEVLALIVQSGGRERNPELGLFFKLNNPSIDYRLYGCRTLIDLSFYLSINESWTNKTKDQVINRWTV